MRSKVRQQPAKERIKNFFEVALGFSKEQAEKEAARCLQCKNPPCVRGCPVEIDIPAFIALIKEGRVGESLAKIKEKNSLPAVCGRVCPQENQCEAACILSKKGEPIDIGALERFAADYGESPVTSHTLTGTGQSPVKNKLTKVAVVGSGPAGLTAAGELAKMGYSVTLFESLHSAGGVLVYGIPEFRLPKKIVQNEVDYIQSLGVELRTDFLVGKTITVSDLLKEGYSAIFIATGAGLPQFLGIPGENALGVYSANEFLTRINLMKAYKFPEYATPVNIGKKVAVIGGGNVALDCARSALRLGKEVILVYRRGEKEMPGRLEEIENAREEEVIFNFLTQPVKIISDKNGVVKGLECVKMELGEPDESGRRRPHPVKDSSFILDLDTIILAIGQEPNPLLIRATPELKTNPDGTIAVDEHFQTSMSGVFAGGDITTGADTVISAMGAGKKAARGIDGYIRNKPK
ncbi:MAG: NADPH-dependent glutamate synthase [Candidatus Omnitrophota bacterium]|nr:NADPH-dependent glutamate synthase [Candidatus Omnitrophota bacterium]